jgi:hypothetical protein
MSSITLTRQIQELIDLTYPDLTPRQRGNKVRDDIHKLYLERLSTKVNEEQTLRLTPREVNQVEQSLDSVPADGSTRAITERIALQSPAIDDQNWVAIRLGVEQAKNRAVWCDPATEKRLIEQLNVDFEDARNPFRVQKSRITAFFARLLDE